MLTVNFTPFPVLTTERLVLRRMDKNDADDLFYLRSHPGIMRFIPRPMAVTRQDVIILIDEYNRNLEINEAITWGITTKENNKVIGTIGLFRMKKENFRTETGYLLHDAWHGKGIMPEALNAVTYYCFRQLGFHSVEALIDPANTASEKLLQKCGFVKEGHFKESAFYNGQFLDTVVYSLLTPSGIS